MRKHNLYQNLKWQKLTQGNSVEKERVGKRRLCVPDAAHRLSFINKVLLKHSYTHLFTYGLWLPLHY